MSPPLVLRDASCKSEHGEHKLTAAAIYQQHKPDHQVLSEKFAGKSLRPDTTLRTASLERMGCVHGPPLTVTEALLTWHVAS